MKKVLSFFITVLALFTLFGCNNNEEKILTVPTNVSISAEGYITWDEVENATSYIVTINGESFVVTTNSYQVKDLKNDFSFTVKALADGYTTSEASEAKSFTGTAASDKEAMTDYAVTSILGTKEEADDKEAFDRQAKMLKEGCFKAYEYGVELDTLKLVIGSIVENDDHSAQTVMLSLLLSVSTLDKDQIVGMTVFADYYAQIFLDSIKSIFGSTEGNEAFAKMLDDTAALLLRNDCEIAVALGHILSQGVNVYNRLSLKVIPQIAKLVTEGSVKQNPRAVVEIKNSIVNALIANPIADEDLAVVLTFIKDWIPVAAPMFADADYKGINIKAVLDKLGEALQNVDMTELASSINKETTKALKSLDFITEDLLTEAFKYENDAQVIAYIVLNGLKTSIPVVNIKGSDLINVAEILYTKIVESVPDMAASLRELLGLTEEDYTLLGNNVAKLVNDLLNACGNFVKDDNNILAIVNALNASITNETNTGNEYLFSDEIADSERIQKVLSEFGIESADLLVVNNPYVVKNVAKYENSVEIKTLTVTVQSIEDGDIYYYYEESTLVLTNIEEIVPVISAVIDAIKADVAVAAKDIHDILKVLVKINVIPEGMAKQFLTYFANASEEDMKLVVTDLVDVLKALVDYVVSVKPADFIYAVANEDYDTIYKFLTKENAELVKTLVNDLTTLLDNAGAFPLTIDLGEGSEMKFETKEEMATMINSLIDGISQSYYPSETVTE